jgi:uncharacterized repeat protein (TIGR01451 family)
MRRGRAIHLLLLLLLGSLPARAADWKGTRLEVSGLDQKAQFGAAVAVSRGIIAVGAHSARDGAGEVYLYSKVNGVWTPQPLEGPQGSRSFGFDVALNPAGDRLLVGAPGTERLCGAAFLYDVADPALPPRLLSLPPNPSPCRSGDELGSAVAIGPDVIAVGARGAVEKKGRVLVSRGGGEFQPLNAPGLVSGSEFGQSLALDDGWLVAGAPAPRLSARSPGAAYLIDLASQEPLRANPLPMPALAPGEQIAFGYAVAVSGDQIAVGAPFHNREAGAVFRYRRNADDGSWDLEGPPVAVGGSRDQLGVAVALDHGLLVVGARYAGADNAGAAYLIAHQRLNSPEPEAGAEFGFAAAVDGETVVIGAFRQNGTGAAYVFEPQGLPTLTLRLEAVGNVAEGNQGLSAVEATVAVADGTPLTHDVSVRLSTRSGTARAGEDYVEISRVVIIPRERLSATVSIQIVGDTVCEPDESFTLELSEATGARRGEPHEQTVTISNDDSVGNIVLSPSTITTSESGAPVPLEVRLTCPPAAPVTVSLSASPPLARIVPAAVRFVPARWNVPATVRVIGLDDPDCEPSTPRSYTITASSTSNAPPYNPRTIQASLLNDDVACVSGTMDVCPAADGTVVYTVVLSNSGLAAQEDLPSHELLDALPPQLSVVSASATSGVATVDYAGDAVAWNGRIPGEGEVMITIIAALHPVPTGTLVSNHARLTFDRDRDGILEVAQTDEDSLTGGPADPTVFAAGDTCTPPPPP